MRIFFRLVLFLFILPTSLLAKEFSVSLQQQQAREGIELFLRRDYPQAESFLKKLVTEHPDAPLGTLGMMAYYQIRNMENSDFRFDAPFGAWQRGGRQEAFSLLQSGTATPWENLMAGAILGISGFYEAHHGHWFAALRDGTRGVHAMQKAFQQDPTLTDALLGMGLYDYWRSHLTRRLRLLPFFPDRRSEGRARMALVAESGSFTKPIAKLALAYAAFQEKRYDEVLKTTDLFLKENPQNIIIRMLRGEAYLKMKKYPEASAEFRKILSIDPSISRAQNRLYKSERHDRD